MALLVLSVVEQRLDAVRAVLAVPRWRRWRRMRGCTRSTLLVTVHVAETTLTIDLGDGDTRVVPRTTTLPVRNMKAFHPRAATS